MHFTAKLIMALFTKILGYLLQRTSFGVGVVNKVCLRIQFFLLPSGTKLNGRPYYRFSFLRLSCQFLLRHSSIWFCTVVAVTNPRRDVKCAARDVV